MAWTSQQQSAIETRDCGLIVSAAAGSGKTSVLVERLLKILMDDDPNRRVPADRMIVVTFTNDAAAEMRSRLYQALDLQLQHQPENRWLYQQQILLQSAHICTISSFCFELIRDNLTDHGITAGFRILNETESSLIAKKAADQVLSAWHETRAKDMALLWSSFCEKDDRPLEQILLDLHRFLGAVPFRDRWCENVQNGLQQPLEQSAYHQALLQQLEQRMKAAVRLAREAADLASELYDSVEENTVLSWVELDLSCLEEMYQLFLEQAEPEQIAAPLQELKTNRGRSQFPRKKKNIADAEAYECVKQMRSQYVTLQDTVLTLLQSVLPYESQDLQQHISLVTLLFQLEEDLSQAIWQTKVQQNALGFEDGEGLALELLSVQDKNGNIHPSPLAQELQEFYQLIMIDEYQDSNNKQDDIFKLLSKNCIDKKTGKLRYGDNVFLVGDVKQSIYRFRLANPQNFVHAITDAESGNGVCQHIALNQNFRSVPEVLSFVNFLCGNIMSTDCGDVTYTEDESLIPGAAMGETLPTDAKGVQVAVLSQAALEQEADVQVTYVVRKIQEMMAQKVVVAEKDCSLRPCTYGDFCVLLRNNVQCMTFAHALEDAGIPVESPEEKGYLQAREISVLLDMLRVLDNPLLDTSLAAVMLSPMFWFTAEELTQVRMLDKQGSLYGALCSAIGKGKSSDSPIHLDEVLVQKCQTLYDTIQNLRQDGTMLSLEALIRKIYDTTDFLSVMQLTKDGDRKRANLHLLLQYAKQYEENTESSHSGVSGFLRYIDWLLESGNDFQQTVLSSSGENAVAVKTMHRSKGLEYPFVFLGKLETGFSKEDGKKTALFSDRGMVGLCIKDPTTYVRAKTTPFSVLEQENQKQSKSEELRLLYVAMTRARQKLFLPLNLDKIRPKRVDHLSSYAAMILPDGKLPSLLVQSAGSMAQWVWMCLLLRHDGELDKQITLPEKRWQDPLWSDSVEIEYQFQLPDEALSINATEQAPTQPDKTILEELRRLSQFHYTSADSTKESLLSVSAVQEAQQQRSTIWNRPKFLQEARTLTGAERGTAVHTFFQYADFRLAQQDVPKEIHRLQQRGFLTEAQADAIAPALVEAFFQSDLYQRICHSKRILREQKFLVQCRDLSQYADAAKILHRYHDSDSILKGIIDLAFQEGEAFVLVDYKTDVVSNPQILLDQYWQQLTLYRAALQCITGMPVTQSYLYSTHLRQAIPITGGNFSQ